jgi:NAD(P)-dependent dehydrogenase (short-subunit alcohol dehydrogenase family)
MTPDPLAAFRLDGEIAVVTGGGRGIGRAVAEGLAAVGATAIVLDVDQEAAEQAAAQIAAGGRRAAAYRLDVTDEAQIDSALQLVVQEHGSIDILVNNAGIAIRQPAVDLEKSNWDKVVDQFDGRIPLFPRGGPLHDWQKAGQHHQYGFHFRAFWRRPLSEHFLSSDKGSRGQSDPRAGHRMGANGIRVNAVAPTWVRTELVAPLLEAPGVEEAMRRIIPLGRIAEPEEVVGAVLFLASPASAMVTGHTCRSMVAFSPNSGRV